MSKVVMAHGTSAGYRTARCRCDECRAWNATTQARMRAQNPEHYRVYVRNWHQTLRREVLDHYGGKCVCCGEIELAFLSLDHKDGGGTRHRRKLGLRGSGVWAWAKREGFPDLFQVMCHNCNQAKGYYGSCPHETRLRVVGDE